MPARFETRRGKRHLIIDIPYRKPDGTWARYRRDAEAATLSAAREEERRIRDRIARTGSPFEPSTEVIPKEHVPYSKVIEEFRKAYMVTELKVTTRRGYETVLSRHLLPAFGDLPIDEVTGRAAEVLDLELGKGRRNGQTRREKGTRNNVQIVLRSTLRFAKRHGFIAAMPTDLPPLRRRDRTILEIPDDEQVAAILDEAAPSQRRAFLLMARAGMRPNEVRGVLWRDVTLSRNGRPGVICVREGVSYGEVHSPKTGQREIPLVPVLEQNLIRTQKRPRDGHVAQTARGKPWGQFGIGRAFTRVVERIGFAGWTAYHLRHYAITSWLRAGVPVHVVQRMAGHTNLSTTQGYVHYLKGDLETAARLIGNMLATPFGDGDEGADHSP